MPLVGCGETAGAGGSGGSSGSAGTAGNGGGAGTGGTAGELRPYYLRFPGVEADGSNPPVQNVNLCEADTENCALSDERGDATINVPADREITFTIEKEGYGKWLMVAFALLHLLEAPSQWTAVVGLITSVLLFIRLTRWQGIHTGSEPLVWVLHVGFSWLPVGFLLLASAEVGLLPQTAGVHALTSGAISTMIIAIAGRAALGHTGRALESHPVLTAAYVLITVAAICRVAATIGPGARALLAVSALAWFLGFVCFAWRYVPILTQPKAKTPGSLPTL